MKRSGRVDGFCRSTGNVEMTDLKVKEWPYIETGQINVDLPPR